MIIMFGFIFINKMGFAIKLSYQKDLSKDKDSQIYFVNLKN